MSIQQYLDKIKNAVYGREVRGAIHDAIKQTYDDAAEGGDANMEVKMARGTEKTLGDRLDKHEDKINDNSSQLAQTALNKADKTYVDAQLKNVADGSPKGTYATLADLQTAFPTGTTGVYLVQENGHIYSYANDSWVDLGQYQTTVESDFPATNLIPDASFSEGRGAWKRSGAGTIVDDGITLVSDGTYSFVRLTHDTTGHTPKKGDKLFAAAIINFKTTNFLDGFLHVRNWTANGTFDSYLELDVSKVNEDQYVSFVVDVTTDFDAELHYYLEANMTSAISGEEVKLSKPMLLNLTDIFGAGNEPSHKQTLELLNKFGGWFDGSVTEFVTKEETKIFANEANTKADTALNKVNAITNDLELVFENMIQNGNFSNVDFIGGNHWRRNYVHANAKNYEAIITATQKDATLSQTIQAKTNHIYYCWAQVASTSNKVALMTNGNKHFSMAHSGSGSYEFLSCKHIRSTDAGVNVEIRDTRESGWDTVKIKYVGAIDLTETFGKGSEPTLKEMDVYIKRLMHKWFDGSVTGLMTLSEVDKHFKTSRKKEIKVIEQRENPIKYVDLNPPQLIMTITYDDESSNIYDLAKPIHESENVPGVFYVVPTRIGTRHIYNYGIADEWNRLKEMDEEGLIAIENHSFAHYGQAGRTRADLIWEIEKSQEMFWRNGIYPKHLAYPGGAHDFNTINVLQDYVQTGVTTSPTVNNYDLNPMRIHRYGMDDKTLEEIKLFIDNAILTGGWLVTYQHDLSSTGMSLGGYQVQTPANQLEIIQYAKSKGVEFVSLEKGLEMYAPHVYITKPSDIESASFAVQRNGIVINN